MTVSFFLLQIERVDQFICRINATVTQLEVMKRIEAYDAVDLPNNDALSKVNKQINKQDISLLLSVLLYFIQSI